MKSYEANIGDTVRYTGVLGTCVGVITHIYPEFTYDKHKSPSKPLIRVSELQRGDKRQMRWPWDGDSFCPSWDSVSKITLQQVFDEARREEVAVMKSRGVL